MSPIFVEPVGTSAAISKNGWNNTGFLGPSGTLARPGAGLETGAAKLSMSKYPQSTHQPG
jgi:hypothetical protein